MKGRELRFYLAASDPGAVLNGDLAAIPDEDLEPFDPLKPERSKLIGQLFAEARNELALERKEEMMSNLRELTFRINRFLKQGCEDEQTRF